LAIPQTDALTADDFAAFFRDKVEGVCSSTATTPLYDVDVPFKSTPTIECEWFTVERGVHQIESGVHQRCNLSPDLFAQYADRIMTVVKELDGIHVGV